jgi:sarcosine oxidase subunit delta
MASLIHCPHCGTRPTQEFAIRSDAGLKRPAPDADASAWVDYVYFRDNPKGRHREHWHHAGGCRRWLIVERDTVTHTVYGVSDASLEGTA